jgi:sortase A
MANERRFRRTALLGSIVAILGLLCVGSGIALLVWRLIKPEEAILLPPNLSSYEENTPTPGLLGSPLAPPPLPTDESLVVMLPVSEPPSPTPTGTRQRLTITATPTIPPTSTPTPTPTPPVLTSTVNPPTSTHTQIVPTTHVNSPTPTIIVSPIPTLTLTPTPSPTITPSPIAAVPDRIIIDAIGLDAPIVPVGQHALVINDQTYSQWDVPNVYAAGWHQNSASLGQPGNTVINGHNNAHGEVFRYLILLKPGDIVTLESKGWRFFYLVAQTMTLAEEAQPVEIRQANARWILPTTNERVTLITCWPYLTSTHRLVVIALPPADLGLPAEIP